MRSSTWLRVAVGLVILSVLTGMAGLFWSRVVDGSWLWQEHPARVPADGPIILVCGSLVLLATSFGFSYVGGVEEGLKSALDRGSSPRARVLGTLTLVAVVAFLALMRLLFP